MNKVVLHGIIKDIQYSHTVQDIEYDKASLIVKRDNGKEDLINLKFKKFSNPYQDGDEVSLIGNVRTYTQRVGDKSKVEIYVFTYFDIPEEDLTNNVELVGRICKSNGLRKTMAGKDVIDFILANNLVTETQSLNCYIPCVAWGKMAKDISKMNIGDELNITGQLQSREYRKKISEEDFEIKVAHEVNINKMITD